jgi:8-oxo-dGTP pyrophosphatase MutT (NUDIX family)
MPAEPPPRRQRVAAYAVLVEGGRILLTQMSGRTRIEGLWTLPGGGIDHGEDLRDAVVREVHEETGLLIDPGRVLDVHSSHFTGPNSDGVVEDYHGIHVIFEATLRPESVGVEPHVLEANSSTAHAAWVPVEEARGYRLLSAAAHALELIG